MFREVLLWIQNVPVKDISERLMDILCLCEAPADKVSSGAFSIICKTEFCSKGLSWGRCGMLEGTVEVLHIGLAKASWLAAR